MMGKRADESELKKKYNQLTVERLIYMPGQTHAEFSCECGNVVVKPLARVKFGHTTSCGCRGKNTQFVVGWGNVVSNTMSNLADEGVCYWAGFLFGDGCVDTKNNLKVCLTSNNEAYPHLSKLSTFLFGKNVAKLYEHSKRSMLSAASQELCDNLGRFGVVPNKTRIQPLVIPAGAIPSHVIRGYFDADGWFSEFVDRNYRRHCWGVCSYLAESLEVVNSYLPTKLSMTKKRKQTLYELRTQDRDVIMETVNFLRPNTPSLSYDYKWNKIRTFQDFYNTRLTRQGTRMFVTTSSS